ncbi:MAG: ABC-type antimicrobial peptide transport system, ATPase component [Candidatus Bipolaricaulis sibiricus]|uniref:ABC-type antimicrobial peptide transport system, ATPase component n=1 Tax=Bipolaricaulis sibiricus TaxID=2501609 RepID=A0A410FT18_BIPS1|nr:MAG: ABC-type antimicrobial peptide transport system, ATPase component [Candidatus Bipolaricaulis sibiricus]
MRTEAVVEARGVHKVYVAGTVRTPALNGVDVTLSLGEFAAMAGPSGSGKSTLLHLLGGLDKPTAGEVLLSGTPISTLSRAQLAQLRLRRVGFVFQAYNLLPVLTVLENTAFVLELQGVPYRERLRRARAILAELGVEKYAHQFPNRLSGGEQQRVAVARAVVSEPAIVLADEPTANLDTKTSLDLIDLMRRMNAEHKTTFLFATHDTRLLDRVDRVIGLEDGRVVRDERVR